MVILSCAGVLVNRGQTSGNRGQTTVLPDIENLAEAGFSRFRLMLDWPRITLVLGVVMGVVLLYAVAPQSEAERRFEELALGEVNTVALGTVAGIQVHCHDLDDIDH